MTPTQPNFIEMPFAYNGGRNTIPASGGEEDGNATLDQGFPIITEQPVTQGGLPPKRKDFNGILYALSSFQFFAQAGGIYTYDKSIDYRTPAMVWYDNNLYICIKNNGASSTVVTPGTNSSYWQDFVEFLNIDTSVAQKLGTATVGSGTKHIYLNAGSPAASSSTVGSSTQPMWLNGGTMTAISGTVGGSAQPMWLNNGIMTAISGTIGGTAQGIYVSGGKLAAMSATVGSADKGVWLDAGVLKACSSSGGISEYKLAEAGYVKFEIGLIIQWGNRATTGSSTSGCEEYTVTFPIKFTSANSYVIMKNIKTDHSSGMDENDISFYSKTASTAKTWGSCKKDTYNEQEEWLAIGY